MADFRALYREHNESMEDFWSRRTTAPHHERTISVFGRPVIFHSNSPGVLDAANLAERMYSSAAWREKTPWQVHLIVHDGARSPGLPPERLIDRIHYAGTADWLTIDLGEWGSCFVDMARGEAHAVISSSLAERPVQVSQVLINTIITNFITRHAYSMLHASALVKEDRILLLMGPHSTGKSTTALRLLLNGYRLLSDSMVYIGEHSGALWMGGFPIGRIKLRRDMLSSFPGLVAEAQAEPVRNETKHRLEMDRLVPELTCRDVIRVKRVEFCLLERWSKSGSQVASLKPEDLWPQIMINSLHYDTPELWDENLRKIGLLLDHSRLHRLRIGTSESQIIRSVDELWTAGK